MVLTISCFAPCEHKKNDKMKQDLLFFIDETTFVSVELLVFSNHKLQLIVLEKCFDKSHKLEARSAFTVWWV